MASGDLRAARRYSTALFRMAVNRNEAAEVAESLKTVTDLVTQSPELMTVLQHPRISRERKKELLKQVFENRVRADVEHFLILLVEKDRAEIIPHVARQFGILMDEHRHETDAEAITAVPLTDAQIDALRRQLQAATGYTVRLKTRVDEKILGGLIVRVGDRLIDGSSATRLQMMREQLRREKVT
jgi:F-type H+-transporting ATPase subunit delta